MQNTPEAQIARLETQVGHLETQVGNISIKLDHVMEKLNEAQGGWKMMLAMSGFAAAIGAVGSWAAAHVIVK